MTFRRLTRGAVFAGALIMMGQMASAQQPSTADLKKDIEALKAGMAVIQGDLQEIKALLARAAQPSGQPPQNFVLDIGNRPVKGQANATLTMVEFSDYQCPFCGRHVRETYPQLAKEYVDTGKVKLVFLDFPLESIHPLAFKAAEAARCAGDQGKYWEMHDQLFADQKMLDNWSGHAQSIGLNSAEFEACLGSGRHAGAIRRDYAQGQAAGVTGTPGFFLGINEPGSTQLKTVRFLKGAQPYAAFKAQIDAMLAGQ